MKKHFTLFAVLTILLAGCKKNPAASAYPSVSEEPERSEVSTDTSPSETTKPSESPSDSSGTSSGGSESSSDSGTSTVSLWGKDLEADRKSYLGGYVLPYINIGKNDRLTSTFVNTFKKGSSYYSLLGDIDFDGSKLTNEFKPAFEKDGFTVTIDDQNTVRTAIKDSAHLKVTISQQDETFGIKVFYDEPFDATKKTAWTKDEETERTASLSGHILPFVYLGSSHPYRYTSYDGKTFFIYGWDYDDSIRTNALLAFKSEDGWNASKKEENGTTKFTAEKAFDDCTLTVTRSSRDNSSNDRMVRTVAKEEYWNPDVATGTWGDDINDEIHQNRDNHDLPYVYLGTLNPTLNFSTKTNQLTIKGGYWNDEVITLAETAFKNANWTVSKYTNSYGNCIRATIVEEDGCRLSRSIEAPYRPTSGKIERTVIYTPSLTVPSDCSDWDEDTKARRTKYFNGHVIPYFYIGAKDTRASFSYTSSKISISPALSNTYNNQMIYDAEEALIKDGYSVSRTYSSGGIYDITATKTFDDQDTLIVKRNHYTSSSSAGTASVNVTYLEHYNPQDVSSWANGYDSKDLKTTTESTRKSGFGSDHSIPFIYLGAEHFYSSWSDANKELTIYGGNWNEGILTNLKTVLANDNDATKGTWGTASETKDSTGKVTYTATKTFTDGATIKLTLTQPSDTKEDEPFKPTVLTLTYSEAYNPETAWDETKVLTPRRAALNNNVIPYVYLHTDNSGLTVRKSIDSTNKAYSYITINGGIWDDRVLTDAVPVFEKDGYTVSTDKIRNEHSSIEAYKKLDDGSYIRILLYKDGKDSTSKAVLKAFYDPSIVIPATATDWDDSIKQAYSGKIYNDIPYFYRGDYITSTWTDKTTNAESYVQFKKQSKTPDGKYYYLYNNLNYILNAKAAFEKAKWNVKRDWFNSVLNGSDGYASFIAEIKNANGSLTRAKVTASKYEIQRKVYSFDAYQLPEAEDQKWSSDDTIIRQDCFYGESAPYVYLGTSNPHHIKNFANNHTVTRQGGIWNDAVLTDAENTFKNDKTIKWTYRYSYRRYEDETAKHLVATGEQTNADGTKSYWTYDIFPEKEDFTKTIQCEIYFFK